MKKHTKQRLMAVFVLVVLSMSSIAYVFYNLTGQTEPQLKPLTSYVVQGEIDPQLESFYIQNGWTFLKIYSNWTLLSDIESFANQAPATFTTSNGQTQLIVQKIDGSGYAVISNFNGENTLYNLTIDELYLGLCNNLMALPAECALIGLNFTGY